MSRQAMRLSNLCDSYDGLPQNGVSRKKRKQQDQGEEQTERDSVKKSQERSSDVLEKTYKLFEAELIEKELQNMHHLQLQIIHDNLTSLNRRHDRQLERYYRTPTGPMQDETKDNLDRNEVEIAELEMKLKKLQEAEVIRRKHVLTNRQAAAAVSSFPGTTSVENEPPREPEVDLPPAARDTSFTLKHMRVSCRNTP